MIRKFIVAAGLPIIVLCAPLAARAEDSPSQTFIKKAIEGNLAEIAAGKLAEQKGATEGVKQFGQMLDTDHTAANAEATKAASSLTVEPPKEPSSEQKAEYQKLQGESGSAFDHDFVTSMIDDHKKAIALYQAESSANDAAGQYAKATLPVLQKHLDTAQQLAANEGQTASTTPPSPTEGLTPGANSFTEGQARARIEGQGFANVADLKLDNQGIWRGTATKNGAKVAVALDFKGNVVGR